MSFINNNWWLVPLIITAFSGILCPAMGTVLITHKRLLQVNLISHCVLPGLALALALGIHPSIGGVISGLLGSVIAESLTNRKSENYEAVMNTILAGMLGFGVLIIPLLGIRSSIIWRFVDSKFWRSTQNNNCFFSIYTFNYFWI